MLVLLFSSVPTGLQLLHHHLGAENDEMPEHKYKVFVNARFDVIWEKLLDKIHHPEKYVEGIRHVQMLEEGNDHFVRLVQFENNEWQDLKELIVPDKATGMVVYRLIDHPVFQGETINICRTTNQIYRSELEYQIDWKVLRSNEESTEHDDLSQQALHLAVNEMKRVSEEAEAVYQKP